MVLENIVLVEFRLFSINPSAFALGSVKSVLGFLIEVH